jgi:hypothetical protein
MGSHPDPAYIREMLDYAMVKARDQDLMTFFGAAQGSDNRRVVTQFFKENYDKAGLSLCSLTCTDSTCSDLEAVRGELLVHVCRAGMIAGVCIIPARAEQAHLVRIRDAWNREGSRGDGRVLQGIIPPRPAWASLTSGQDKDTSKFTLVLQQSLDSIASNSAWIKASGPASCSARPFAHRTLVSAVHWRCGELAGEVAVLDRCSHHRMFLCSVSERCFFGRDSSRRRLLSQRTWRRGAGKWSPQDLIAGE